MCEVGWALLPVNVEVRFGTIAVFGQECPSYGVVRDA